MAIYYNRIEHITDEVYNIPAKNLKQTASERR